MKRVVLLALVCAFTMSFAGCSKKADENKPLDQVKAEAEKMSVADLRSTAMAYKDAIAAKVEEVQKEGLKLKDVPLTEMLGDKAKTIKAKVDELQKSVSALTERYKTYLDELKKKGGDLTGLQL